MRPSVSCRPSCTAPAPGPARRLNCRPQSNSWPLPIIATSAGGRGGTHAAQPHELPGPSSSRAMARMCWSYCAMRSSSRVHFAEQVADHEVGVAGQVLQAPAQASAAHGGGLQRQHDAELAEQAADAVERGRALLTKPWRARCTISRDCCSTLLTGTKRMCGRCTASQIAAASAASFLPRLPLMRYGVPRTSAPSAARCGRGLNSRAQWCAPEHASIPTTHGGSEATNSCSLRAAPPGAPVQPCPPR
jgi:hypothetical protein